ncbi:MAG: plasmid partition protein ParG [Cyanobacteria bacterium J06639_18]
MNQKSIKAYLDSDLHKEFKVECVKRDLHMSDVIAELIKEWLKKIKKKN